MLVAWTDERLFALLKIFVNQKPTSVSLCAFIDGLDEFIGEEEMLLDVIRLLNSSLSCKVCVLSRPEQVFREEFKGSPRLRVQDLNEDDMRTLATKKLVPYLETRFPSETLTVCRLVEDLVQKAEGVFLWLDLMVKDLIVGARNLDSLHELRLRLARTPGSIMGMYAHKLQSLDSIYLKDAFRYFQMLLAANSSWVTRSVDLSGLACTEDVAWEHVKTSDDLYFQTAEFAALCQGLETRLVTRCAGLVEVQENFEVGTSMYSDRIS
ncbi:MAG: hypothetical protein Q9182_002905 [Xanthomendoza sp. 2 TL-2023]